LVRYFYSKSISSDNLKTIDQEYLIHHCVVPLPQGEGLIPRVPGYPETKEKEKTEVLSFTGAGDRT